jgi:hypothetical protein
MRSAPQNGAGVSGSPCPTTVIALASFRELAELLKGVSYVASQRVVSLSVDVLEWH